MTEVIVSIIVDF